MHATAVPTLDDIARQIAPGWHIDTKYAHPRTSSDGNTYDSPMAEHLTTRRTCDKELGYEDPSFCHISLHGNWVVAATYDGFHVATRYDTDADAAAFFAKAERIHSNLRNATADAVSLRRSLFP